MQKKANPKRNTWDSILAGNTTCDSRAYLLTYEGTQIISNILTDKCQLPTQSDFKDGITQNLPTVPAPLNGALDQRPPP